MEDCGRQSADGGASLSALRLLLEPLCSAQDPQHRGLFPYALMYPAAPAPGPPMQDLGGPAGAAPAPAPQLHLNAGLPACPSQGCAPGPCRAARVPFPGLRTWTLQGFTSASPEAPMATFRSAGPKPRLPPAACGARDATSPCRSRNAEDMRSAVNCSLRCGAGQWQGGRVGAC